MIITKASSSDKAKAVSGTSVNLGSGNIVPHWWYKAIKSDSGKTDLVAIAILSELWFLHRKHCGVEFNEGYAYFERKFEFTRAQLQEATLRLHSADIAIRSFRTVVVHGRNFPNELHLKINLPKLLSLKAKYVASKNNDEGSSDEDEGDFFDNEVLGNSIPSTSEKHLDHISNRKISLRKNRSTESIESSVFKNSFLGLAREKAELASFYPLVQSDIALLRRVSGRDFTITAVNEILLKLSKRHTLHRFPNKEAFMSYMGKVLSYEMRDAMQISSVDFKLNCNRDQVEVAQARYLEEVEYSKDTSPIAQLRRKLAAVLAPKTAYQFLKAAKIQDWSIDNQSSNNSFPIELSHELDLSDLQQQMILEQVRAVFGNHINKLEMVIANSVSRSINANQHFNKSNLELSTTIPPLDKQTEDLGIWGMIRSMLVSYYGEDGKAIDTNWFSKLEPEINDDNRSIILRAPSDFIKDWVQAKYSTLIEKLCHGQNYNLIGVSC